MLLWHALPCLRDEGSVVDPFKDRVALGLLGRRLGRLIGRLGLLLLRVGLPTSGQFVKPFPDCLTNPGCQVVGFAGSPFVVVVDGLMDFFK